jgi:cation diffusion facilitator family transporter
LIQPDSDAPSSASSRRTVYVALASAVLQTVALGVAAGLTGSGAILAQTAANVGDVAVQVFLLVGVYSSVRDPDDRHPIGYGRDRYFWSLFAALGIFVGGVFVAFNEALHAAMREVPVQSYEVGFVVLVVTIALDAVAFAVGLSGLRRQSAGRRRSLHSQIIGSSDLSNATVVLGSGIQLVGGVLALAALIVEQRTGNTTVDALASAVIGLLLVAASIVLLEANRELLVGRGIPPNVLREMRNVIASQAGVLDVPDLFAVVVGPSTVVVDGDVTLDDDLDVPAVEATIANAAAALRGRWPAAAYVYLMPVPAARPRRWRASV